MVDTIKRGQPLPPIWVTLKGGGRFQLKDGNARVTAYLAARKKTVPAVIVDDRSVDLSTLPEIEKSAYLK